MEQKEGLLELVRGCHAHHDIGPEVRREIVSSKCRDLGVVFGERQKGGSSTAATPMQE